MAATSGGSARGGADEESAPAGGARADDVTRAGEVARSDDAASAHGEPTRANDAVRPSDTARSDGEPAHPSDTAQAHDKPVREGDGTRADGGSAHPNNTAQAHGLAAPSQHPAPPPRIMGLETEYGIIGATSEEVVEACLEVAHAEGRPEGVRWDYSGEFPLRDARGFEVDRSAVDPSLLTDVPGASAVEGPVPGRTRTRTSAVVRLTRQEEAWQRGTATCLPDGGRLYVDHGHPEYATPECTGPAQTVLADRAGELLLSRAAALLRSRGTPARLFKNNVDGKGATYGTHENYLVPRSVDFDDLVAGLVPFLVVRPALVGAGRVGRGVIADNADFQICQRADYLETVVGLGTTTERPIVNTRDEPHADPEQWRRLHVIVGDANTFDTIAWLKLGMTSLVLQAMSDGLPAAWRALELTDPVAQARALSHDVTARYRLELADGRRLTADEVLGVYLDGVREYLVRHGLPFPAPDGDRLAPDLASLADGLDAGGRETGALVAFWQAGLEALAEHRGGVGNGSAEAGGASGGASDTDGTAGEAGDGSDATTAGGTSVGACLEWAAKHELIAAAAGRHTGKQGEAVLHAVDLSWSELGACLAERLDAGSRARSLLRSEQIEAALSAPPETTRAWLRGALIGRFPGQVFAAGWHSMVLETGGKHHRRLPLTDPLAWTRELVGESVSQAGDVGQVLAMLTDDEALPSAEEAGPPEASLPRAGSPEASSPEQHGPEASLPRAGSPKQQPLAAQRPAAQTPAPQPPAAPMPAQQKTEPRD